MRRLLVNALSVTNPSGLHVLRGHLDRLADGLQGRVRLVVVCREDLEGLRAELGSRADWEFAPASTRGWFRRACWERANLARLVQKHGACAYFTPSGIAAHPLGIPQIVFCQNPWALVPAARRRRDAFKAWLQRRAYRRAMRMADAMVFLSRYLKEAYRRNAGCRERRGLVAYAGVDRPAPARAAEGAGIPRQPAQIASVSVMAPHKNIEALVRAFHAVRAQGHPEARLVLAGPWPDPAYERWIRRLVGGLGLAGSVEFAGFVSRDRLDRLYAESRVFCLMSRCESFGIPAIEAQHYGTPVVSSSVCAIPEVCGGGGWFRDPDDVAGIAEALRTLIEDEAEWKKLSALARENAERFAGERVSKPLVDLVAGLVEGEAPQESDVP